MEITENKKSSMPTLMNYYDWHTKLFNNVIEGISDSDAQNRLGKKANHVAWIAGSLVQERFVFAGFLGIEEKQTSDKFFENHKGIQDNVTYPSLSEYKKDWERISPVLRDALAHINEEKLNSADPWEMPGGPFTFFDAITFFTDRESYCIGQVALYRRLLGYDAMKYD